MPNSYRIRTNPGVDKSINVQIDQEFEYIEILSLKILQSQIYTRQCSDYGVIVGRVSVNNGFGIPNAKVSVFIPLTAEDELNPIISELYPYKTLSDRNEDNYRYNLLPYKQSHSNHNPTGTFFDRMDVLTDPTLIEVYDKYFKYTTTTNESGDYMIFGVPIGNQTMFVDIDLSDIGEFSLTPQDLIRMGITTEAMVDGTRFKASENLDSLPQIVSFNRDIDVVPLWGEPEICNIGITRTDFDLTRESNIEIKPTAIFLGSMVSNIDGALLKRNCKPQLKSGQLCSLVSGPGQIQSIRQTIFLDSGGRPFLEEFNLDNNGQVIDEDGTWVLDVPMNLDYVVTNEFGEQVLSSDPKYGVPTRGKYRFKVKWNQQPELSQSVKRAYYLVPNVREYGYDTNGTLISSADQLRSYAFSVDWNDYGDATTPLGQQMITDAINCEDKFYEMSYNKVYTVSNLITQYRKGYLFNRTISIKNILDDTCESTNNKFPANDGVYRLDFIFLVFRYMMFIFRLLFPVVLFVLHLVRFIVCLVAKLVDMFRDVVCGLKNGICGIADTSVAGVKPFKFLNGLCNKLTTNCDNLNDTADKLADKCKNGFFPLPNMTYPDCDLCNCEVSTGATDSSNSQLADVGNFGADISNSPISGFLDQGSYTCGGDDSAYVSQFFAGSNSVTPLTDPANISAQTPGIFKDDNDENGRTYFYGSNLTIPERLNLFNTKSKYFNADIGGGVNQIKMTFCSQVNDPITTFHYDNVIMLIVPPSLAPTFEVGKLMSFNDVNKSSDPNLTANTVQNQFGTNSITGTPVGTQFGTTNIYQTPTTLTYVKPDGTSGSVSYIITGYSEDSQYLKFPTDVEYFQVIHSRKMSEFLTNCGTSLPDSLSKRFLNNDLTYMKYIKEPTTSTSNVCVQTFDYNLNSCYNGFGDNYILFLTRGVDPHSTRTECTFDLSKLYGHSSYGVEVKTELLKLNIPIQGFARCVKHDAFTTSSTITDPYSGEKLFYDSFQFLPDHTISPFQGFTTTLTSYYSSVDETNAPGVGAIIASPTGVRVSPLNEMCFTYYSPIQDCTPYNVSKITNTPNTLSNRGYFPNESVEGGSMIILTSLNLQFGNQIVPPTVTSLYFGKKYNTTTKILAGLGASGRQMVMRSDRLPTSTNTLELSTPAISYPLYTNGNFNYYLYTDDGTSLPNGFLPESDSINGGTGASDALEDGYLSNLVSTLQCENYLPLECYYINGSTLDYYQKPNPCYLNSQGEDIMVGGCWRLATIPFVTYINDLQRVFEWYNRTILTFAACRNVFSHTFTNNWINGTLYVYPFKNETFFDSNNQPVAQFCTDTVILDPNSLNFFYRSTPYSSTGDFVGINAPNHSKYKGNVKNLLYPTTMMDLGPRDFFTQEVTMTDEFDGYIVDKLNSTSFQDVDELLNVYLLFGVLTGSRYSTNILRFFDARGKGVIDGDYAQMLSINSEFGVKFFDQTNYTDPADIYLGWVGEDNVFGVFYKSNSQDRDYITPKRTIYTDTGNVSQTNCFDLIPVKSQKVPFYQWTVNNNTNGPNTIFGSQSNDWNTTPLDGVSFFSEYYQSLDRLVSASRYFRTNNLSQTKFFKGYIYSVDGLGNLSYNTSTRSPNTPTQPTSITVGAPFYFYFGLTQGASAFDKFARIWIEQ